MQPPLDLKRKKIVHDFAKWTALSALRSGSPLKSAKQIYNLIETHGDFDVLFCGSRRIREKEFDQWHKKTVLDFVNASPALSSTSQVGWAAKIVNIYLKTRVYLAGEGRPGLAGVIHPPFDSGLITGLKRNFPSQAWRIMRIKNIQSYRSDYLPFVEECRRLARVEKCLPVELEFYWR